MNAFLTDLLKHAEAYQGVLRQLEEMKELQKRFEKAEGEA